MDSERIKSLFKKAERDFSLNWFIRILYGIYDVTDYGFCKYFRVAHNLTEEEVEKYMEPIWLPFRTKCGAFHFHNNKERVKALRKINKILENLNNK